MRGGSDQEKLMRHFDSLRDSKASVRTSGTTSSEQYHLRFQAYSARDSLVDSVSSTFENAQLFEQPSLCIDSIAFLSLPAGTRTSVEEVGSFFEHNKPFKKERKETVLTSDRFASFLVSYPMLFGYEERKGVKNKG